MSKRLEILERSLKKKEETFNQKLNSHIDDVKRANGQPLNDKRNGQATLNRWDRQSDSLRNSQKEIEKTKNAIERETTKENHVTRVTELLPECIVKAIGSGELIQWKKYPNMFFVPGVDKARIIYDIKTKLLMHKYTSSITDPDQRRKFAQTFNQFRSILSSV